MTSIERAVIALDLYPANVDVAGTSYVGVRAVVADGVLAVYKLGAAGPEAFYTQLVTGPLEGSYATGVVVPTESANVFVEQSGGCACGSRLKTYDLFPGKQKVYTGLR